MRGEYEGGLVELESILDADFEVGRVEVGERADRKRYTERLVGGLCVEVLVPANARIRLKDETLVDSNYACLAAIERCHLSQALFLPTLVAEWPRMHPFDRWDEFLFDCVLMREGERAADQLGHGPRVRIPADWIVSIVHFPLDPAQRGQRIPTRVWDATPQSTR